MLPSDVALGRNAHDRQGMMKSNRSTFGAVGIKQDLSGKIHQFKVDELVMLR